MGVVADPTTKRIGDLFRFVDLYIWCYNDPYLNRFADLHFGRFADLHSHFLELVALIFTFGVVTVLT